MDQTEPCLNRNLFIKSIGLILKPNLKRGGDEFIFGLLNKKNIGYTLLITPLEILKAKDILYLNKNREITTSIDLFGSGNSNATIHLCARQFCPFLCLLSGTRGLMQSFGFVLTSLCGSTETAATKEPLGILESGNSSTRTHNCTFLLQSSDFIYKRDDATRFEFFSIYIHYLWRF